jgi:hypothetical protein
MRPLPLRSFILLAPLFVAFQLPLCSQQFARTRLDRVFRLVSVADQPPQTLADTGNCEVPRFSEYTLRLATWFLVDSLRLTQFCGDALPAVRVDSGYYRVVQDSVHFYVWDTRIGLHGWVAVAVLHGDSLIFTAGEFDPGDYVYFRVPFP